MQPPGVCVEIDCSDFEKDRCKTNAWELPAQQLDSCELPQTMA